jgi:predicted regulator of amino acid metabolism with ACT domain
MKTRQKSKIEDKPSEAYIVRGIWRLDVEVDKQEVLKDLEMLSTVSAQAKRCESSMKVFPSMITHD